MPTPRQETVDGYMRTAGFFDRLFVRARARIFPFEEIDRRLPASGLILDIGCGHGLLANFLARSGPRRKVIGIDLSVERIAVAKQAADGLANLEFRAADLADSDIPSCDAILVFGVLCLIPVDRWLPFFAACSAKLREGGVLLLQEVERRGDWMDAVAAFEQRVFRATGVTLAEGYFTRSAEEIAEDLRTSGFEVDHALISIPGHPARLFSARKAPGKAGAS